MRSFFPVFLAAVSTILHFAPLTCFADDPATGREVDPPISAAIEDRIVFTLGDADGTVAENQEVDQPGKWPVSAAVQTKRINAAFNQYVLGGSGPDAIAAAKARLDFSLVQKIESLDAICHLTDKQKQRLTLAGRGDITRLLDRVEAMRKKFHVIYHNEEHVYDLDLLDPQTCQDWKLLLEGPFGEQSLLAKTERQILSADQFTWLRDKTARASLRDPAASPRQICVQCMVLMVDDTTGRHRPDPEVSDLFAQKLVGSANDVGPPGKPTIRARSKAEIANSVELASTLTCEIAKNPFDLETLRKDGGANVVTRPMIRTPDNQMARVALSLERPVRGLQSGINLSILPTVELKERLRLKINLALTTSAPGLSGDNESLGSLECLATCTPGEHVVIRRFRLPNINPDPDGDDHEAEAPNGNDPEFDSYRELVFVLWPRIVSDDQGTK